MDETEGKFCCICLATESPMFVFNSSRHIHFIKSNIKRHGCNPSTRFSGNDYICYDCNILVARCFNFVQTAVYSQRILEEHLKANNTIPFHLIKSIDRNQFNFNKRTLKIHKTSIDFYFTESEQIKPHINNEDELKTCNDGLKIKVEVEPNYQEFPTPVDDPFMPIESFQVKREAEWEESILIEYPNSESQFVTTDFPEIKKERKRKKKRDQPRKPRKKAVNDGKVKVPIKREKKPLQPSKFMESLASVSGKRPRNKIAYNLADECDKFKKKLPDDEYKPASGESSDANSVDLYTETGRRVKKEEDTRTFPMKCEQCPVEVLSRKEHHYHYMQEHFNIPYPYRRTTINKFLCQTCGKTFPTDYRYRTHVATHDPEKKVPCETCGKKYASRKHLLKHMKRHDENVKYVCDYCNKIFKTKTDVRTHIRVHTGEKPYKCHICGEGFAHNGNVGIHIRSRHQQTPNNNRKRKTKKDIIHKDMIHKDILHKDILHKDMIHKDILNKDILHKDLIHESPDSTYTFQDTPSTSKFNSVIQHTDETKDSLEDFNFTYSL